MENEGLIKIADLAKRLEVSVPTVRGWLRKKLIPAHCYIKVTGTYRFDYDAVVEAFRPPQDEPEKTPTKQLLRVEDYT